MLHRWTVIAIAFVTLFPLAQGYHFPPDNRYSIPSGDAECDVPVHGGSPKSHALFSGSDNGYFVFLLSGENDHPVANCDYSVVIDADALVGIDPGSYTISTFGCTVPSGGLPCTFGFDIRWEVTFYDGLHVHIGTLLTLEYTVWIHDGAQTQAIGGGAVEIAWPCSHGHEADPVCSSS